MSRSGWVRPGLPSFALAALFVLFAVLYRALGLPTPSEVVDLASRLYSDYGVAVILAASFIEGLFVISFYFPGSAVLLLAVLLSDGDLNTLGAFGLLAWIGTSLAGIVNYYLGKLGYYSLLEKFGYASRVDKMRSKMKVRPYLTWWSAGFHPTVLSVAFVCAGIARLGLLSTLAKGVATIAFWITVWLSLYAVAFQDEITVRDAGNDSLPWMIAAGLVAWGLLRIVLNILKKPDNNNNPIE